MPRATTSEASIHVRQPPPSSPIENRISHIPSRAKRASTRGSHLQARLSRIAYRISPPERSEHPHTAATYKLAYRASHIAYPLPSEASIHTRQPPPTSPIENRISHIAYPLPSEASIHTRQPPLTSPIENRISHIPSQAKRASTRGSHLQTRLSRIAYRIS